MTHKTPPTISLNWQKNITFFLFGQFLSGITSMIVQYAIIWYLTEKTGSATVLSFATLLGMLPMVLLSPFVGPFVDRLNKKKLLITTDLVVALFALILALAGTLAEEFPLWLVFVSLFIRSVAQTFQMPTIQSILPTMVPETELTRVNGQLGMVSSANMIIAPAFGAYLFSVVPMNYLILLDVLGAILGISLLLFVTIPRIKTQGETVHILADSKFGFKLLIENKGLWAITLIGTFFTLLFMPAVSMYPLMTLTYFKGTVQQAGLIEVIYSIGMLAGGIIIGIFGKWHDRMKPILLAYFVIGLSYVICGYLPSNQRGFFYFILLNALCGLATPFFNTLLMAMIQQSYKPQYLGRVLGVLNAIMSITGPIGLIFAGPLADQLGVEKLFVIAGIGTIICGLVNFFLPVARNYDKTLNATLAKKQQLKVDENTD
ncbi:MFS transporter [Enterococcus saigonensis]|uniref:MFS transporter n=1 Tax=Enterococcus saigonensis TaxID=1805431 RepID=A0A679INH5_9ENTE|nr:MFS transporter [Enterococcus saigonensis]BCA85354.1 MFS transporter [Enterococcus saigonensis]